MLTEWEVVGNPWCVVHERGDLLMEAVGLGLAALRATIEVLRGRTIISMWCY